MRFLFFLSKPYSLPIISPIIDYLKSSGQEYLIQISPGLEKNLPEKSGFFSESEITACRVSSRKFNPDFVIIPGNFVDHTLPGIKVQIFHGIGIEKRSHFKLRPFFDVYCTSGPFVTEKFLELKRRYPGFEVIETGWPKVDYIMNFPVVGLRDKYNIPDSKKIILYAPTFSRKFSSIPMILPVLNDIISDDEFWLIKVHDLARSKYLGSISEENSDRFKFIAEPDITPCLHLADVMLSDTSSVVFEFMLLNKPVITFRATERLDKGINISSITELRPALERTYRDPHEFKAARIRNLKEINPRMDGSVSSNLIKQLIDLKKSGFTPAKKRIGLWRRFQVNRWLRK